MDPIKDHAEACAAACLESHARATRQARRRQTLPRLAGSLLERARRRLRGAYGAHTDTWGNAFFEEFLRRAESLPPDEAKGA